MKVNHQNLYKSPQLCYNTIDSLVTDYFLWKEFMANITRISAGKSKPQETTEPVAKQSASAPKLAKVSQDSKMANHGIKTKVKAQPAKKTGKLAKFFALKPVRILTFPVRFLLIKPLSALGKYLYASWQEIRQVHWPSRKTTWKMTGVVILYTAFFALFIIAIDFLMTLLFNQLLKK